MKILIVLIAPFFVSTAMAKEIKSKCYAKAESSVESFVEENYYDQGGFTAYKCEFAANNKVVICEVAASKGQGAATDTFRVVLNSSCTKKYRVEMIGEE